MIVCRVEAEHDSVSFVFDFFAVRFLHRFLNQFFIGFGSILGGFWDPGWGLGGRLGAFWWALGGLWVFFLVLSWKV